MRLFVANVGGPTLTHLLTGATQRFACKTKRQYDVLYRSTFLTTLVLGDCGDYPCARGLSRPLSCSGTVLTTLVLGTVSTALVLGDCPDYLCARGLSRLRLFSGIRRFPHAALENCPDHSPTIARGPLSSATCDLYSHTVERHLFFLT